MISMYNVDKALKDYYLDAIADALNTCSPFYSAIEKSTDCVYGKDVKIAEKFNDTYTHLCAPLSNIYATIEINEKALISSSDSTSSLVNLLNAEIEEVVHKGISNLQNMLFNSTSDELIGLNQIFNSARLYDVDDSSFITPHKIDCKGELALSMLEEQLDNLEQTYGVRPDMILCSFKTRRKFDSPIAFEGIPLIADRYCSDDCIYFIYTGDFSLQQLCDWEWIEDEEGKILHRVLGKNTYTATLVKYAQLICRKPYRQTMFYNISN